jgi:hypothetical protein
MPEPTRLTDAKPDLLSPAERQEAERLCAAATQGPWKPDAGCYPDPEDDNDFHFALGPMVEQGTKDGRDRAKNQAKADAMFIAQARTLLPRALATIAQLEAERDARDTAQIDRVLEWKRRLEEAEQAIGKSQHYVHQATHNAELADLREQLTALTQERDGLKERLFVSEQHKLVAIQQRQDAEAARDAAQRALDAATAREQALRGWLTKQSHETDPEFAWAFDEALRQLDAPEAR